MPDGDTRLPGQAQSHRAPSRQAAPASLAVRIRRARERTAGRLVLTTSFGLEDQLLTHVVAELGVACEIVTLDTGRLFAETYALWQATEARYGVRIAGFTPDRRELEPLVTRIGINGFRDAVEHRRACCHVRKVEPLGRALAGASGWISGLRADQSGSRSGVPLEAADPMHGLTRFHPLFDWTRAEVEASVHEFEIPYNPLHDKGMLSIGCQPCTRAVLPGEDERAGRWWWERDSTRECGLHVGEDGRLVRSAGATGSAA